MSVSRSQRNEVPDDAVVITQDQALIYQWRIITDWENKSEVWALRYTPGIIGTFSALTGIFVNNHYRTKLRLGNYGKLSTYLPIVVIPAVFSALAHRVFVQKDVILDPMDKCPLCLQLRAAAVQSGLGVAYPTILAPFAAFMFATRHYTYRLPLLTKEPLEVLKLWRNMTRPVVPTLATIAFAQAIISMYLTYKQMDQNFRLQFKLKQLEKQYEEAENNQLNNA